MPRHDGLLALVITLLVGTWGILWLYRRDGRRISRPKRGMLALLRLVTLAVIVVMLLEPVLVFTKQLQVPSRLIVLNDASDSMTLRDAFVDPNVAQRTAAALNMPPGNLQKETRAELARRVIDQINPLLSANGDREVRERLFTGQLSPPRGHAARGSIGDRHRRIASTGDRGRSRAAAGGHPAHHRRPVQRRRAAAAGRGVCGGGGHPHRLPRRRHARGPAQREGDENRGRARRFSSATPTSSASLLESRGWRTGRPRSSWKSAATAARGKRFARQPITLEENGQVQSIPFDFKEDRPARLRTSRHASTDVGPELTTDDNVATEDVRVIRQKIHVLFIAGNTFPEVEFLRNALLRDMRR